MRIGIPLENGVLAVHFGHCRQFGLVDADVERKTVECMQVIDAPPHEPGVLPRWLASHNVDIVITAGMGKRATSIFQDFGIEAIMGAPQRTAEQLALDYLGGTLATGANRCER